MPSEYLDANLHEMSACRNLMGKKVPVTHTISFAKPFSGFVNVSWHFCAVVVFGEDANNNDGA